MGTRDPGDGHILEAAPTERSFLTWVEFSFLLQGKWLQVSSLFCFTFGDWGGGGMGVGWGGVVEGGKERQRGTFGQQCVPVGNILALASNSKHHLVVEYVEQISQLL